MGFRDILAIRHRERSQAPQVADHRGLPMISNAWLLLHAASRLYSTIPASRRHS
jgi:hypothetical protein